MEEKTKPVTKMKTEETTSMKKFRRENIKAIAKVLSKMT